MRRPCHRRSRTLHTDRPLALHLESLENRLALTTLLPGFSESLVANGFSGPTAMEFSPDGRLWVLEQAGRVKLVRDDGTTFTALTKTVDSSGERGLLGIAFDPNFTTNHFVYLYYTNPNAGTASWATGLHNQISRFTVDDTNPAQPLLTSEAPILDLNNLSGATNHNGGAIHFSLDGLLYANTGDNVQNFTGPDGNSYRVSQTLANMLGKQLRIDVARFNSGAATRNDTDVGDLIPSDNPFVGTATGINQLIYVLGLRNPFTFAVQPGTGRILINDVGEGSWEEVDESIAGGNYGWRGGSSDGFNHAPPAFAPGTYHDPLLAYAHSGSGSLATGSAIVGSTFYNPSVVQFPASFVGQYFYQDLGSGFIRYFDPNTPNNAATPDGNSHAFASGTPGGLRDLKVADNGTLIYLSGGDGSVRRITYTASQVVNRQLFYNQSTFDGNNASPGPADDAAIALNKTAYLPGAGTATFASVSSYTRGINGLMIDLQGAHGTITANDFTFKAGNNNSPSTWSPAPAPAAFTLRAGAGTNGSDRLEITWPSGAIQGTWLEVIVRGNDALGGSDLNTGLVSSDVFYFGSAPADSGAGDITAFVTNATDEQSARNDPHGPANPAAITNVNDYNRDGRVNATDQSAARAFATSGGTALQFLNVGVAGPFAPELGTDGPIDAASDAGIATSLTIAAVGKRDTGATSHGAASFLASAGSTARERDTSSVSAAMDLATDCFADDTLQGLAVDPDDELLAMLAESL